MSAVACHSRERHVDAQSHDEEQEGDERGELPVAHLGLLLQAPVHVRSDLHGVDLEKGDDRC